MNSKEINLNEYRVIIIDAPIDATHAVIGFHDGANYLIMKKNKIIGLHCFDQSASDSNLSIKYKGVVLRNIGKLATSTLGIADDLFNVVKHGNFYDYEYNGVFYPSAISALSDIVSQETSFSNPFVLVVGKPHFPVQI